MASQVLTQYLNNLKANLRLENTCEKEVLTELSTHIEDQLDDMMESGLSEEDAAKACIRLLGSEKLIAKHVYETHSQGSWKQAIMASVPHIIFAMLFALNWWQGIGWVILALSIVIGIAIAGWLNGRPMWLFPWLGYSIIPVLGAGILLLYLPKVWSWITILIYIPLALILIFAVTIRTIRKDWLYSALMLLPLPIIFGWFLAVEEGMPFDINTEYTSHFAPLIAMSFLALAGVAAAFIRMRKRWLRATLIIASQLILLILVTCYAGGRIAIPSSVILSIAMVGLLIGLCLLDHRIRYKKR